MEQEGKTQVAGAVRRQAEAAPARASPRRSVCAPGQVPAIIPQTVSQEEYRTMSLTSFFRRPRGAAVGHPVIRSPRASRLRPVAHRLAVERLEYRTVPSLNFGWAVA